MSGLVKYVIINDCDVPQPDMVCQWVPGVGYCYLDRSGNKPSFDGMKGDEATPINMFGILVHEAKDRTISFKATGKSFARYLDGRPRRWQSSEPAFTHKMLMKKDVRKAKGGI